MLEHASDEQRQGEQVIFDRRISARRRGILSLIAFVAIAAGVLIVTELAAGGWREDWLLVTLVVIVGLLGAVFSLVDIVRGGAWCCRLTSQKLSCRYPSDADGEDFDLPLERIHAFVKLIEFKGKSSDTRYFIEDVDGNRYAIDKRQFCKPGLFTDKLKSADPRIEYREESRDLGP